MPQFTDAEYKQEILKLLAANDKEVDSETVVRQLAKRLELPKQMPPVVRLLGEMHKVGLIDMEKQKLEKYVHPQWMFSITENGKKIVSELKRETDPKNFEEFFEADKVPSEWVEQALARRSIPDMGPGGDGI